MNEPGEPGAEPHGAGASPRAADPFENAAVRECLRRAVLHELPAGDRLLLLLWYAEGMSPDEIAACLLSTPKQVEAAHGRVLGSLRRLAGGTPLPVS